jgi:hypothetical protein
LIAKKDGVLHKKASFTVEKPAGVVVEVVKPPEDPFARLSNSIEKAMIIDRAANIMGDKGKTVEVAKGADPAVTMMMSMITGMQLQNTELMKIMMTQRNEKPGGNDALIEAIKLGSALAGGKLPVEEGEGGIMEMLKPLIPAIPQILAMLTGKGPRPPVLTRPVTNVPPHPVPAPAPVSSEVLAEHVQVPPTPEEAKALVMGRIVDEVKFVLSLPVSPKLREHVIEYIESYAPDILRQAEVTTPELFAGYVVTLDPAFAGKEQFFIDLHKQYISGLEEVVPGPEDDL